VHVLLYGWNVYPDLHLNGNPEKLKLKKSERNNKGSKKRKD